MSSFFLNKNRFQLSFVKFDPKPQLWKQKADFCTLPEKYTVSKVTIFLMLRHRGEAVLRNTCANGMLVSNSTKPN